MASCQKLGIILVINGFKNWFYQKMSITTNVLLNWYSSMKKKIQKDSDDFWHRKLTLKVKFWRFLTARHQSKTQNSIISFGYVDSYAKICLILYPPTWKLHNPYYHSPYCIYLRIQYPWTSNNPRFFVLMNGFKDQFLNLFWML